MESIKDNFLSWSEISSKVDNGETLNPIDQFLYDWEPAGIDGDKFREQLFELLQPEEDKNETK